MTLRRVALVCGLALSLSSAAWAGPPASCQDLLFPGGACTADPGAAVQACCPCDGFANHGQYVRCVVQAVNALKNDACLDNAANGQIKRCAARSTCGKPEGFVKCCRQVPGVCKDDGFCAQTEPAVACVSDLECPPMPKCSIKASAEFCIEKGGTPGVGSCCGTCEAPVAPNQ
jgi:hypothetical protein